MRQLAAAERMLSAAWSVKRRSEQRLEKAREARRKLRAAEGDPDFDARQQSDADDLWMEWEREYEDAGKWLEFSEEWVEYARTSTELLRTVISVGDAMREDDPGYADIAEPALVKQAVDELH